MTAPALPLAGVKVVDLTTIVLGPLASQTLAGLGAEVVKIEAPEGDNVRNAGVMKHEGMGHVFLHGNTGKRSVVLDLKQESARRALLALLRLADVFLCNVRPAAMRRLGLDTEALKAANPRLIQITACGYGSQGPYASKPAYDDLIQAATGIPSLMESHTGGPPRYAPVSLADRVTGLHVVYAVTAALYARERTGRGQHVEVPMYESVAHFVLADHLAGKTFDPPLAGAGYDRLISQNRRPYPTRDGYLSVLIYNDRQWERFLGAVGQAEKFHSDPRFSSQAGRSRNIHEVYGFVGEVLATRSTAEWVQLLDEIDIPNQVPVTLDELLADEHLRATGLISHQMHPTEGLVRTLGSPTRWEAAQPPLAPAPRLGEHSEQVLAEAGFSDAEIQSMIASGALGTAA